MEENDQKLVKKKVERVRERENTTNSLKEKQIAHL